jgi:hypothetical protein
VVDPDDRHGRHLHRRVHLHLRVGRGRQQPRGGRSLGRRLGRPGRDHPGGPGERDPGRAVAVQGAVRHRSGRPRRGHAQRAGLEQHPDREGDRGRGQAPRDHGDRPRGRVRRQEHPAARRRPEPRRSRPTAASTPTSGRRR